MAVKNETTKNMNKAKSMENISVYFVLFCFVFK